MEYTRENISPFPPINPGNIRQPKDLLLSSVMIRFTYFILYLQIFCPHVCL